MQKPTELITSRQNSLVSLTVSLSDRRHRQREGLFRFDGKKLFLEALDAALPLVAVLFRASSADALLSLCKERELPAGCRGVLLSDTLFDRISEEKSPEGVICVCAALTALHQTLGEGEALPLSLLAAKRVLLLESVRDPGNLGTVLRAARAFGTDVVVLSADCADIYHARTVRGAMGTLFSQPIYTVPVMADAVRALAKTRRVFAATLDARAARLGSFPLMEGDAVLVGNEGHGLSAAAIAAATDSVFIPMEAGVESLNAGVAASVLMWEIFGVGKQ